MRLRETKAFIAARSPRGVRLTAKERNVTSRSRVVRLVEDWENYLRGLGDESFNAACVIDFGVGVWTRNAA
jgi:hypothetical protein